MALSHAAVRLDISVQGQGTPKGTCFVKFHLSAARSPAGMQGLALCVIPVACRHSVQPLQHSNQTQMHCALLRGSLGRITTDESLQVYLKYGLPKLRPFPGAIKAWVQPASAASDFQYLILAALFINAPRPMFLVRTLSHAAAWHMGRLFPHLPCPHCLWNAACWGLRDACGMQTWMVQHAWRTNAVVWQGLIQDSRTDCAGQHAMRCSILNTASNKSLRSELNSMANVLDQEQKLTEPSSSSSVLQW